MILAHLTIVAAVLVGGHEITVQPTRGARVHSTYLANLDRPSERTLETLRRYSLEYNARDATGTLARLEQVARQNPESELVYALAELSWVEGRRLDRWRKPAAIDRYVDAVAYAYDFLLDPEIAQPADPRYRYAMELYNGGLERLIRAAQANKEKTPIEPDGTITLNVHGREQILRVALLDSPWKPEDIDKIVLACDYEVVGLPGRSYQFGLGVPLIGIRQTEQPGQGATRFYPPEMAFALTAYLVPNSRLRDPNADIAPPRECTLQLVDPVRSRTVGPTKIPVESDLTTPLGYMWSRTDLNSYRWTGLMRPGEAIGRANLMLLRPYEPGKIPVVMVHGLISSPLAWISMINELFRDPMIQDRYQFLLYMYPTGVPVPVAASMLRDSLRDAEKLYNPDGRDPAFGQMVLLGHSMGGLLSHAMAVASENKLWQLNSDRAFDEMIGPRPVLDELQHYLFFDPLPFVRRVVFLATPHRGSDLSRGLVGRVGTSLIADSDHISDLLAELIKNNPNAFDRRLFRRMPTSIEMLEPDNPARPTILMALRAMTPRPGVTFHSIIGSLRPGPVESTTDGVVSYRSSHLDGVESELIVRSNHGVQANPEAILEVRRILREQIGLTPARLLPAAPGAVEVANPPVPLVR